MTQSFASLEKRNFQLTCRSPCDCTLKYFCAFIVRHSIPDEYPSVVPVFELEAAKHHEMTMSDADYVYDQLLAAALSHIGTVMVYDLVSLATDLVEKVVEKRRKKEAERAEAEQVLSLFVVHVYVLVRDKLSVHV